MDMKHLDPLRAEIQALRKVSPPKPWRTIRTLAVGGLRAVGFDRQSDLLLVVSIQGRGVIDCRSGAKVARDDEEYYDGETFLEAAGIGPLQGATIRMSGLFGGGLPIMTADGWSVELVALDWPLTEILLLEPGAFLYDSLRGKPCVFHKIGSEVELKACGFSYSGRSLIVATSSDLTVFGRDIDEPSAQST